MHEIRSHLEKFACRFAEYAAKILRNFVKFYLDAGKIAAATDKICSSLDKTARDNRQNSVKISRRADWVRPC